MKCKVCGHESGKYPLCKACNIKKKMAKLLNAKNAQHGTIHHRLAHPLCLSRMTINIYMKRETD